MVLSVGDRVREARSGIRAINPELEGKYTIVGLRDGIRIVRREAIEAMVYETNIVSTMTSKGGPDYYEFGVTVNGRNFGQIHGLSNTTIGWLTLDQAIEKDVRLWGAANGVDRFEGPEESREFYKEREPIPDS